MIIYELLIKMIIEKITENVYSVTDGSTRGNITALILPNQCIFIDTGMDIPKMKEFREYVEAQADKDASILFITHEHGDHVFGNQIFEDCRIITSFHNHEAMKKAKEKEWTPENIQEWIANSEDPQALNELKIVLADETFEEEYELIDENITVLVKRTGGHTSGSSYVYCPNYKILVAGDNLFNESFPWGGAETADPYAWIQALEEYLSLDVEYYIPGHGPVSGSEEVEKFLAYLKEVLSLMEDHIAEGMEKEEIIKAADNIEYYPPSRKSWKKATLEKWYNCAVEHLEND